MGVAPDAAPPGPSGGGRVDTAVRTLDPGAFALVMATGIVSVAVRADGAHRLSAVLLWLAGIAYLVLVAGYAGRAVRHGAAMAADLRDPARAFGYLTFVAATDVLGQRLAIDGHRNAAIFLLAVGSWAWLLLGYLVPWALARTGSRAGVVAGANGSWFLWAVGSQSVAVLAAALAASTSAGRREFGLLAVLAWSVGLVLYATAGIFVTARLLAYGVSPEDLTPAYWVAMGATAITAVAGVGLLHATGAPSVTAARQLIVGVSLVFWAFGTWLIPALLAAGWWRHVVHRVPLRYQVALWSIVFPLGMYAVAARDLGGSEHLPIVTRIGTVCGWVALGVWAVTFAAMIWHIARVLRSPAASPP